MPGAATGSDRNLSVGAPRWRRRAPVGGGLALLALIVVALPLALPNRYFLEVAILVGLNAIVCVGLNLLIGYAGQISLGHAGFFALGAYASAILSGKYGWPVWLSMPSAVVVVGALAFVVGRPTLKLRGHYLAMATLGLGVIASTVLATEDAVTGGPDGMAVPQLRLFGVDVHGELAWYAVVGAALCATVWLARNLVDSPLGRALRALHGSEVAAETVGVDSARSKLHVFTISAVVAAAAGTMTAHYAGFITPAKASFLHSVELVTMVVFGGMASIFGAVIGAAVLTTLPQVLTVLKDYEMVVFGAVLVATMAFFPRGIVPTLAAMRPIGRVDSAHPFVAPERAEERRGPGHAATGGSALTVRALGKRFGGVHAIEDLSFEVRPGTVHSIIGPNGAGKTTLLNLMTGVYAPDTGHIRLGTRDLTGSATHRFAQAGLGRTFQNLQVFFNMSALENVMTGRHLHESHALLPALLRTPAMVRAEADCRGHAIDLMRRVGLDAYVDSPAEAMPYGALKRLEIARALAGDPALLLLDEPAAGLNATEAQEIELLIRDLCAGGTTIVLVEHNMRLVMGVSDTVLVLDRGRKLAEGRPDDIARNPAVVEAYLGAPGDADGGDRART